MLIEQHMDKSENLITTFIQIIHFQRRQQLIFTTSFINSSTNEDFEFSCLRPPPFGFCFFFFFSFIIFF